MSILIRLEPWEAQHGVPVNCVRLSGGTLLGRIEPAGRGAFIARTAQGHLLAIGDAAVGFATLTDAAAHLWMAFMAGSADLDPTLVRSDHVG